MSYKSKLITESYKSSEEDKTKLMDFLDPYRIGGNDIFRFHLYEDTVVTLGFSPESETFSVRFSHSSSKDKIRSTKSKLEKMSGVDIS